MGRSTRCFAPSDRWTGRSRDVGGQFRERGSEEAVNKYGPHDFNGGRNWFYVNEGSVDVCNGTAIIRIPRSALYAMRDSLGPLLWKPRKSIKGRLKAAARIIKAAKP